MARLTLLLTALLALGWSAGGPKRGTAVADPSDPTRLLVAVLGLAAWACAAYLLLVLALTWAARAPGLLGRGAAGLARRVAPAALRRTCELALGLTLAAAPGAVPALAAPTSPTPAPPGVTVTTDLDWPGVAGRPGPPTGTAGAPTTTAAAGAPPAAPARSGSATAPPPPARNPPTAAPPRAATPAPGPTAAARPPTRGRDRPSPAPPPGPAGPAPRPAARPHPAPPRPQLHSPAPEGRHLAAPVLVRPGDSLWSLAARALGPGATDRQVATSWPAWWSANRQVIGEDPDLLQPGMRLVPPRP